MPLPTSEAKVTTYGAETATAAPVGSMLTPAVSRRLIRIRKHHGQALSALQTSMQVTAPPPISLYV